MQFFCVLPAINRLLRNAIGLFQRAYCIFIGGNKRKRINSFDERKKLLGVQRVTAMGRNYYKKASLRAVSKCLGRARKRFLRIFAQGRLRNNAKQGREGIGAAARELHMARVTVEHGIASDRIHITFSGKIHTDP